MSEPSQDIFKSIDSDKAGTTAEEVVTRLREMIHRGDLRSGDRLPPERDLAKPNLSSAESANPARR